jgi:hypothetical protein
MPGPSLKSSFRVMLGSEVVLPFILGSTVLGLFGNALYALIESLVEGRGFSAPAVAVLLFSVAVFGGVALYIWWRAQRNLPRSVAVPGGRMAPQKRRGIILLISANQRFVEAALRSALYHKPALEYAWLVYTNESEAVKDDIRAELIKAGLAPACITDCHLTDPLDPLEVYRLVDRIYLVLPPALAPNDVILDFLGLTAVCSVGAVLACMRPGRPIQYTPPAPRQTGLHPADPIEIPLTWAIEQFGTVLPVAAATPAAAGGGGAAS